MSQSGHEAKLVAIWGARGFVGTGLADGLRRRGYRLLCVGRGGHHETNIHGDEVVGDANSDLISLLEEAWAVVNLAGCVKGSREALTDGNVEYQRRITSLIPSQIKRVIHVSTLNSFFGELDFYGTTKREGERIWREAAGDRLVILRPGLIVGGSSDSKLASLIKILKRFPVFPVFALGSLRPIHLNEFVDHVLARIDNWQAAEVPLVICGREACTYTEFVRGICQTLNIRCIVFTVPRSVISLAGVTLNCFGITNVSKKIGAWQVDRSKYVMNETADSVRRLSFSELLDEIAIDWNDTSKT